MADETKAAPPPHQCPKCSRAFRDSYNLGQHRARKRPCAPVLEAEDLPTQEQANPNRCRFCGRTFSRPDAVKRHQRQNCRILREDQGLEILYDHVLKRSATQLAKATSRISELEAERATDQLRLDVLEARLTALDVGDLDAPGVRAHHDKSYIDASVRITNNIAIDTLNMRVINIFGREDTAHIPAEKVRRILRFVESAAPLLGAGDRSELLRASAVKAVCAAALLIYSDPDHPENITCYLPNKRDGTALVHGAQGWEIQPVPLVIPPMAENSVGLLFSNQPFDGDLRECEAILAHLRDSEREIVGGKSPCEASMKAILIRNKDLLTRVLANLPVVGDE
jgi:hypothetical protein